MKKKLLLIEDDPLFQRSMIDFLSDRYKVIATETAEEAIKKLRDISPDVVLLDVTLPGMDGRQALIEIKKVSPDLPVTMLTAMNRIPFVVECIKLGAFDFFAKPVIPDQLVLSIEKAIESVELKREIHQLRNLQLSNNKEYKLIGTSPALEKIRKQIATVAGYDSPILVEGNTGTGKELIARTIHSASDRATGPFVAVNCGAIPKDLMESEFFGYKKGAFSGAYSSEIGKFALANRGTLVLDEISELPLESQTKLLRILEEKEFYPVGSTQLMHVDVRIVATTNRNLFKMAEERLFREDLFYRLNVYNIVVPPLSERKEDIVALCEHFLKQFNIKFSKNFKGFSEGAMNALLRYAWPGNGRELRNILERLVLSESADLVQEEHLNFMNIVSRKEGEIKIPEGGIDLEEVEKGLILQALRLSNGNKTKAAKLLNLTPPTLYYRLEKFGLGNEAKSE
jgi:two-component system, NtrC family, response regulator AtoC